MTPSPRPAPRLTAPRATALGIIAGWVALGAIAAALRLDVFDPVILLAALVSVGAAVGLLLVEPRSGAPRDGGPAAP